MAISGRLDETSLASLLQVFSQSRKSGRLSLARGGSRGVILLREGKLIYAGSSSVRETLGNVLVCEQRITERTLAEALERQHAATTSVRLGAVLVEMGAISFDALRAVIEEQALKVLQELLQWQDGFFQFHNQSFSDDGLQSFDLYGFPVEEGLRIDRVLLDLVDLEVGAGPAADSPTPAAPSSARRGEPMGLREISHYLNQPVLNAEMTVALLQYASSRCDRAALLMKHDGGLRGIAQSGLDRPGEKPEARIRDLEISLSVPSAFADALESREPVHGRLDDLAAHRLLIQRLGGDFPSDSVVVPMVVHNQVAFVLYADVLEGSLREVEHLEVLMLQAGLSMEKAMLELRVETLEQKLDKIPQGKQPETPADLPASASLVSQLLSGKREP